MHKLSATSVGSPLGLLLASMLCCLLLHSGCSRSKLRQAPSGPPEVQVTEVKQRDVPIMREWVSTLDGSTNVSVKARVQGYLQKQAYIDGSVVKAGDLLFEIDPRPFEAALAQAKANLANAQANQVQAGLDETRKVELFATRSISQAERDQAVQANAAAKATVLAMQAAVETAQLNLGFTKVTAPVAGIAGIAQPNLGDLVGPSSGEMCSLSTVEPIKAIFQITEQQYLNAAVALNELTTQALAARPPQIELVLADGSVYPHKGKFSVLNLQIDPHTGTIELQALFPNPGNILRPGLFARVRVPVAISEGALLVPQRAVAEMQGAYQVAVVDKDGKVSVRRVKTGPRYGTEWVIEHGLVPGDRVVVEGVQFARDGITVKTKPYVPPPLDPASASDLQTTHPQFQFR